MSELLVGLPNVGVRLRRPHFAYLGCSIGIAAADSLARTDCNTVRELSNAPLSTAVVTGRSRRRDLSSTCAKRRRRVAGIFPKEVR